MFSDAVKSQSTSNSTGSSGGKEDKSYFAPPPAISLPKDGGAIKGLGVFIFYQSENKGPFFEPIAVERNSSNE